jgi:hypothetical protein
MWWDLLPIIGQPKDPLRTVFDAEVLRVLSELLVIPHDACRESALHGINHWRPYYPDMVGIVDDFLSRNPHLRPELIAYAQGARTGGLQ